MIYCRTEPCYLLRWTEMGNKVQDKIITVCSFSIQKYPNTRHRLWSRGFYCEVSLKEQVHSEWPLALQVIM